MKPETRRRMFAKFQKGYDSPLASAICRRKIRFETRRAAKDFMRRRGITTQEPYNCEGCSGVHLRTKSRRPA